MDIDFPWASRFLEQLYPSSADSGYSQYGCLLYPNPLVLRCNALAAIHQHAINAPRTSADRNLNSRIYFRMWRARRYQHGRYMYPVMYFLIVASISMVVSINGKPRISLALSGCLNLRLFNSTRFSHVSPRIKLHFSEIKNSPIRVVHLRYLREKKTILAPYSSRRFSRRSEYQSWSTRQCIDQLAVATNATKMR